MKEKLKKIPFLYYIVKKVKEQKGSLEFFKDRKFFLKHHINNKYSIKNINYDMMMEVHKLEKGFSSKNPRPFGKEKIDKLLFLLNKYDKLTKEKSFYYKYSIGCLKKYIEIYEEQRWTNLNEYKKVVNYLKNNNHTDFISSGTFDLKLENIKGDFEIDYLKFLSSRHSVRSFSNQKLKDEDIKKAVLMASKTPSACNRQMCKIYKISKEKQKIIEKYAQGLSTFDVNNCTYFIITFDVSAFSFIGERNQGYFNAGLFSMNFVNALHSLSIGSCFIQFGNTFKEEEKLKKILNIPESERISVIIASGYYEKVSKVLFSKRKQVSEIYKEI